MNSGLEKKISGQMEDSALAMDISIKTHGKLCDHEKEAVEKTVNNVKANGDHIVLRIQEPSS